MFFFCFIWRVVLIRYSDWGLVLNGRPNTQLLKKLHWVTFISFVSINILHFPIQRVISGTFKETILGKVFNIYWSYKVSPTFLTRKV